MIPHHYSSTSSTRTTTRDTRRTATRTAAAATVSSLTSSSTSSSFLSFFDGAGRLRRSVLFTLEAAASRKKRISSSDMEHDEDIDLYKPSTSTRPSFTTIVGGSEDDDVEDDYVDEEDEDDDDDDILSSSSSFPSVESYESDVSLPIVPDEYREIPIQHNDIVGMTVQQLKQQLRLRNMKVTGRKTELINRLLGTSNSNNKNQGNNQKNSMDATTTTTTEAATDSKTSKARQFAKDHGKELIDVSEFLDPKEVDKDVRSSHDLGEDVEHDKEGDDMIDETTRTSNPEVWGKDAMIVDDYEGRQVIVDGLSRTVIEYFGSNQTLVQARVVASRNALRPFLAGAGVQRIEDKNNNNGAKKDDVDDDDKEKQKSSSSSTPILIGKTPGELETHIHDVQLRREKDAKRPVRDDDHAGLDEGDETGIYDNVLHRDPSDWGKYTPTGAQVAASQITGVLMLSDVYGAFSDDAVALSEKIAFECQPCVVMVPDLFREHPWKTSQGPNVDDTTKLLNVDGQSYEEWRSIYAGDELRVSVDIRAAAACLRERYGVSSIAIWGMCYGGGRALEIASNWLPNNNNVHDVDGVRIGPPLIQPNVVIAWYPTRYNVTELFGQHSHHYRHHNQQHKQQQNNVSVMAIFAGKDQTPGATSTDADMLKKALEDDERIHDHLVKVFPDQDHGFAHQQHLMTDQDNDDEMENFLLGEFGGVDSYGDGNVVNGNTRLSVGDSDADLACLLSTGFMETYSRTFLPTVGSPISLNDEDEIWNENLNMKHIIDDNDDPTTTNKTKNRRDIRQEIQDATDNFVQQPLEGYRIDPSNEDQDDELARLLRTMQDPNTIVMIHHIKYMMMMIYQQYMRN